MSSLKSLSNKLKFSAIHPQWISNRYHLKRLKSLSDISNSLILDIGSGDTNLERHLGKKNTLIKLDYPSTNEKYKNKPNIFADASALPIKSESIDKVFLFEVIEHLNDDIAAISEISRILKPQGTIYISAPFTYPLHDLPYDFRRYTPGGLTTLLEANNFSIHSLTSYPSHWATLLYLQNMHHLSLFLKINSTNKLISYLILPLTFLICFINNILALIKLRPNNSDRLFLGTYIKAIKNAMSD